MGHPRVVAVVVTYNRRDLLIRLLGRLATEDRLAEVVVVDNASTDGTAGLLADMVSTSSTTEGATVSTSSANEGAPVSTSSTNEGAPVSTSSTNEGAPVSTSSTNEGAPVSTSSTTEGATVSTSSSTEGVPIHAVTLERNTGGAGGFAAGMRAALERGADLLWLMDDDGVPEPGCLETLLERRDAYDFWGPVVLAEQDTTRLCFPIRLPGRAKVVHAMTDVERAARHGVVEGIVIPFNGVLATRALVEQIGPVDERLFIWGDDVEWRLRAERAGARIATVVDARFRHPATDDLGTPMMLSRATYNHSPSELKGYCMARNNVANLKSYRGPLAVAAFVVKTLWFYLFTRPDLRRLRLSLGAMHDGFYGRWGRERRFLDVVSTSSTTETRTTQTRTTQTRSTETTATEAAAHPSVVEPVETRTTETTADPSVVEPVETTTTTGLESVAVVVVTHNRAELLAEMLVGLHRQSRPPDQVYVVDNASTDHTARVLEQDAHDLPLVVLRPEHNLGGAGGFHLGMRQAHADGHDRIWLMDDDVVPAPSCLTVLLAQGGPCLMAVREDMRGALVEKSATRFDLRNPLTPRPKRESVDTAYATREAMPAVVPVEVVAFEGFLVSREVVDAIGLPDPSYFIFYDDVDFALRARAAGFPILAVRDAVLVRQLDFSQQHDLAGWKGYYMYRNLFVVHFRYGENAAVRLKPYAVTAAVTALSPLRGGRGRRWSEAVNVTRALRDARRMKERPSASVD